MDYLLKIRKIKVSNILISILETTGKKKVKLPFLIKISPGSLPKPNFSPNIKTIPIIDNTSPIVKIVLPNDSNPLTPIHLYKVYQNDHKPS